MKTVQNLTLTLILTLTLALNLTLKNETKERNLEKGKKREHFGFELPNSKTNSSTYDNPINCAIRCKLHNFFAFYSSTRD